MQGIIYGINNIFNLYFFLIILRIFLTWIPSINWDNQPLKAIREICDIYLDLFRRIVPPVAGLDFSPIIALIVLQIIQYLVIFILKSVIV